MPRARAHSSSRAHNPEHRRSLAALMLACAESFLRHQQRHHTRIAYITHHVRLRAAVLRALAGRMHAGELKAPPDEEAIPRERWMLHSEVSCELVCEAIAANERK